jgi:hypothetical protein
VLFRSKYPVRYGDGMYTTGEFIRVERRDLLTFLAEVAKKNGRLTEQHYYIESRYFELEVPK